MAKGNYQHGGSPNYRDYFASASILTAGVVGRRAGRLRALTRAWASPFRVPASMKSDPLM